MAEIERKYLITEEDFSEYPHTDIVQGYLSISPEIRIRNANNQCFITYKSDGDLVRDEEERPISLEVFNILKMMIIGNFIYKTRYHVPIDNHLAEVDIFKEQLQGLKTVEVEFSSLEDALSFPKPSWFLEEITDDPKYKNKNLAQASLNDKTLVKKNV